MYEHQTRYESAFLENVLGGSEKLKKMVAPETVTYYDSFHLKRGPDVWKEVRALLDVSGFQVKEMKNADRCCAFSGTYSFLIHPQISRQITRNKFETIRCAHTIELLAESLNN